MKIERVYRLDGDASPLRIARAANGKTLALIIDAGGPMNYPGKVSMHAKRYRRDRPLCD
jgi:hypothetical protein